MSRKGKLSLKKQVLKRVIDSKSRDLIFRKDFLRRIRKQAQDCKKILWTHQLTTVIPAIYTPATGKHTPNRHPGRSHENRRELQPLVMSQVKACIMGYHFYCSVILKRRGSSPVRNASHPAKGLELGSQHPYLEISQPPSLLQLQGIELHLLTPTNTSTDVHEALPWDIVK